MLEATIKKRRLHYAGLVMYNEWKTLEEQNKHCIGFLMKRKSEVDHAPPGETQTRETLNAWR